uniref:MobA/MobL protein n=1 Tax=Cyanothece sp. (strain PCC 7425 / ATCC 29141) TaxID=395961 RepID=B8HWJ5_CYAP4
MGQYFFTLQLIGKRTQKTIVPLVSYCSDTPMFDHESGTGIYYANPRIKDKAILAPEGSPAWVYERELLWHKVEAIEERKDAQLARYVSCSLPGWLSQEQQVDFIHTFVKEQFVSLEMIADVSLELLPDSEDNVAIAHILLTLRPLTPEGEFGLKDRNWNRKNLLVQWRRAWAGKLRDLFYFYDTWDEGASLLEENPIPDATLASILNPQQPLPPSDLEDTQSYLDFAKQEFQWRGLGVVLLYRHPMEKEYLTIGEIIGSSRRAYRIPLHLSLQAIKLMDSYDPMQQAILINLRDKPGKVEVLGDLRIERP